MNVSHGLIGMIVYSHCIGCGEQVLDEWLMDDDLSSQCIIGVAVGVTRFSGVLRFGSANGVFALLNLVENVFFNGVATPGRVLESIAVALGVIMLFHLCLELFCPPQLCCSLSIGLFPSGPFEGRHRPGG